MAEQKLASEKTKLEEISETFVLIEMCHGWRKGKLLQYVNDTEMLTTKKLFEDFRLELSIPEEEANEIVRKNRSIAKNNPFFGMAGAEYNQDTANNCSNWMQLFSIEAAAEG